MEKKYLQVITVKYLLCVTYNKRQFHKKIILYIEIWPKEIER